MHPIFSHFTLINVAMYYHRKVLSLPRRALWGDEDATRHYDTRQYYGYLTIDGGDIMLSNMLE